MSSVLERFLRYVVIDTQSDAASTTQPSTAKQLEPREGPAGRAQGHGHRRRRAGPARLHLRDDPGQHRQDRAGHLPLLAHGHGARLHRHQREAADPPGLQGRRHHAARRHQPRDPDLASIPSSPNQIGNDIVTSDGTTLLGADDKAGLAEIMAAAEYLLAHPEVKHGAIRILFTPDEEIGRGVDKVDIAKLGAAFGYTVDGETAGDVEDETFSADGVEIAIRGVAMHPGFAKDRMENAIKIAGEIVAKLPQGDRARDDRGQGGLHSPRRRHRLDGPGQAHLHHPRFRGGRPRREGTAARGHRPRRDRGLPGLDATRSRSRSSTGT